MKTTYKAKEAIELYEDLKNISEIRTIEVSRKMNPYIEVTDTYGKLISRIVLLLGTYKPVNTQDTVLRDLLADVFDCLYESRTLILAGKLNVSFPMGRKAYESLSLLALCALDSKWAEKWQRGKKISNSVIRKELARHPMGEQSADLKELYSYYCLGTHPNRVLVASRFLGEGNEYVLGSSGSPNLVMVIDYCIKNLQMWFWLTASMTYFYIKVIQKFDAKYLDLYMRTKKDAEKVIRQLGVKFNQLLKEEQEYWTNLE